MRLKVSGSRWEGRWEKRGRTRGRRNPNQDNLCEKMAMFHKKGKKNKRNCSLKMASTTVTLWVTTWVDFDTCVKQMNLLPDPTAKTNFKYSNTGGQSEVEKTWLLVTFSKQEWRSGCQCTPAFLASIHVHGGTMTQERTTRLLPKETWKVEQVNTRC